MIKDVKLFEILNSRKEKTIKAVIKTENGEFSGSSPSGKSKGSYESKSLDTKLALGFFKIIKRYFINENEKEVDKIIENLGIDKFASNLSTALSIAAIRACCDNRVYNYLNRNASTFPYPLGNVIGGGAHGGKTYIQEFLVAPLSARTISEAIKVNSSLHKDVGRILKAKKRNDEGAWISKLNDIKTLDFLSNIAEDYYVKVGIDFAASQLFRNGHYFYLKKKFTPAKHFDFIEDIIKTYKLFYIEDPFNENDFESFSRLTRRAKCLVVGDDIFATNERRLERGIKRKACNGVIIKPNQVGTISKTLKTIRIANNHNYATIVSHRSGETMDSFISDLAVATKAPLIKCGIFGKERIAKLNRLRKIWNELYNPKMARI